MTNRHFVRAIIIRIILMLGLTITGCYLLFLKHQLFWSITAFLFVLGTAVSALNYFNRVNRWIASFMLGIENEDTSLL
jgi:hypothetical protein